MTVGIVFYAESALQSQSGDIARWTNLLEKLDFDFYIVIDDHDIIPNWVETKTITGVRVDSMAEAITHISSNYNSHTKVKMVMTAETKITDYTFPTDVIFFIGSDQNGLDTFKEDTSVKCITANELWAIDCLNEISVAKYIAGA